MTPTNNKLKVQDVEINIRVINEADYISLTDMTINQEEGSRLIEKQLTNKNTIEYLGVWEELSNPNFNSPEFEGIKKCEQCSHNLKLQNSYETLTYFILPPYDQCLCARAFWILCRSKRQRRLCEHSR